MRDKFTGNWRIDQSVRAEPVEALCEDSLLSWSKRLP